MRIDKKEEGTDDNIIEDISDVIIVRCTYLCVQNMDSIHKGPKAIIYLGDPVSWKVPKRIRLFKVWNKIHDAFQT